MNFPVKVSRQFYGIFVLFLTIVVSFSAHSQLNSGNLTQYTEKDGMPGLQVNKLLVDKRGFVWTGTINGLARYDGNEFKRFYFMPNDSATIHGLIVSSLFEDGDGKIWAGCSPSYLNRYDPVNGSFRQYNFQHLIQHPVFVEINNTAICDDNNGRIYFGMDTYYHDIISGALLYKDKNTDSLKQFKTPDSLAIQNIYRMTRDRSGNIWIFSYSGMFKIDTHQQISRVHFFDNLTSIKNDYPADMQFDSKGGLWIISQGLLLFEINPLTGIYKKWFPDTLTRSGELDFISKKLLIDKDDNIWIGSNNGLQFLDRKSGKFSLFNNGVKKELEHLVATDLVQDNFGTIWIGSFTSGLIKYENRPQLRSYSYKTQNSLTSGWASNICESSDGKIWISTDGSELTSGLNILDTRTWNMQSIPYNSFAKRTGEVSTIWENVPGEMYVGNHNSIYAFSEKTHRLSQVRLAGIPDTIYITQHLKDSRENEWISAFKGLYKKSKGELQYRFYDISQIKGSNASSNQVTRMYEGSKHGLWILTNNGLFLYNYKTDKIERHGYDKKEGDIFVTQDINSLFEDPQGIVWVGTWQGGLSRYDPEKKKIKTYTLNEGLPSMSIQGILADEKNNTLWLSTFEGLSRFQIRNEEFNNFSLADGIQGQLFADGSSLKTSGGLFVFGGANGITIFNPDEINLSSQPPIVFLTDLKLFNKSILPGEKSILKKPVYETEQIELAYNQNNISLEFIALHYSNPGKNRYSYKLENYDNEWRDIGNLHVAFYPNLPPGKYVFRVKAANDKGVWNEKGATLSIIVNRPWWLTNWAYIVYGLLLLLLIFAADRYLRHRLLERERERNSARELEQAKEIEKAYYKLEETHETLKTTQSQLIQSEKMASLGELTAGIAHEIQNPLNFVNNFSEVNTELIDEMQEQIEKGNLEEVKTIAKDIKENEQKINHHGKRADGIVQGMLQHSRSSNGMKEATDINALADEYLRLSYHGLRAKDKTFNATIKTDFDKKLGKVNIIPQDIGRVLLNLYNNAFYAMNEKKSQKPGNFEPLITVTTRAINPAAAGGSQGMLISIKDNGSGIPKKVLDKIFQPFFTTKPAGQGTGLGLSLSYDIITKGHGGELKVETREGEGTEFIIQLPLVKE